MHTPRSFFSKKQSRPLADLQIGDLQQKNRTRLCHNSLCVPHECPLEGYARCCNPAATDASINSPRFRCATALVPLLLP